MGKTRKRRTDAVQWTFHFYGCADYVMKVKGKSYVYDTVLSRLAKQVAGENTAPVFSLYRELHRTACAMDIHGVRAICIEDFNAEGRNCTINVFTEEGKNCLMFEEEI